MRHLAAFILLTVLAHANAPAQCHSNTCITGHVFYQNGAPVDDAEVEWHSFSGGGNGITPPNPHSDKTGFYLIENPAPGEGVVSASKRSEGYPNAAFVLYGRTGYASLKHLEVVPGHKLTGEDLKFRAPDALLHLTTIDAQRGTPVKSGRVLITWPGDTDLLSSEPVLPDGQYQFVLPQHTVAITVNAPGYTQWEYKDPITGKNSLIAPVGTQVNITAKLTPK